MAQSSAMNPYGFSSLLAIGFSPLSWHSDTTYTGKMNQHIAQPCSPWTHDPTAPTLHCAPATAPPSFPLVEQRLQLQQAFFVIQKASFRDVATRHPKMLKRHPKSHSPKIVERKRCNFQCSCSYCVQNWNMKMIEHVLDLLLFTAVLGMQCVKTVHMRA